MKPLSYLYYEVTRACNHRCVQCFNNSLRALPGELDTAGAIATLRSFRMQGGRKLQITGGDPFVRADIHEILGTVADLDFDYVIFSTNGLLLTEERADDLIGIVDEIDLSLDGFQHEHDLLRGVRCWDQSVRAIRMAAERGFRTYVCCCLTAPTLARIDAFLELLIGLGVDSVKLAEIGDVGRRATPPELRQFNTDRRSLFDRLSALSLAYRDRIHIAQSLQKQVVPPDVDRDGLVADPTGRLFPLIGYLPARWAVGRTYPDWRIDDASIKHYMAVVQRVLALGIDEIARGEPVNWWTLLHGELVGDVFSEAS